MIAGNYSYTGSVTPTVMQPVDFGKPWRALAQQLINGDPSQQQAQPMQVSPMQQQIGVTLSGLFGADPNAVAAAAAPSSPSGIY